MKQHYVPKVYLKRFAEKIDKDYFVDVYDKIEDKFKKLNTKNILAENNVYTLDLPNSKSNDPLVVEKIYSDFIEKLYDRSIEILLNKNRNVISNKERAEIMICILHLYYRNPNNFRKLVNKHIAAIKMRYNYALNKNVPQFNYLDSQYSVNHFDLEEAKRNIEQKTKKIFKENHLDLTAKLGEIHEFTIIEIYSTDSETNFFTNDNPLMFEDFLNSNNNPFLKSAEFTIPLTKKHFVKLSHDKTKNINNIYRYKISGFHVNYINDEIFNNASRFVVCNREEYDQFLSHKEIWNDTSLEKKMNLVKQIIQLCEEENDLDEYYHLNRLYYQKYLTQNNYLSKLDEFYYRNELERLSKKHKSSIIE